MQLVDHRGLADAGITGHEHQLGCSVSYEAIEGREQGVDLALPPVQPFRDHEPVRPVLRAKRERVDPSERLPYREATLKISLQPGGGLVALLGGLGQKLHHDRRELRRYCNHPFARRDQLARDMAVDPSHRIGGGEGQRAREELVECAPPRRRDRFGNRSTGSSGPSAPAPCRRAFRRSPQAARGPDARGVGGTRSRTR
jgi:hypothetical protein